MRKQLSHLPRLPSELSWEGIIPARGLSVAHWISKIRTNHFLSLLSALRQHTAAGESGNRPHVTMLTHIATLGFRGCLPLRTWTLIYLINLSHLLLPSILSLPLLPRDLTVPFILN